MMSWLEAGTSPPACTSSCSETDVASELLSWADIHRLLATAPSGIPFAVPTRGAVLAGVLGRGTADDVRSADWILCDPRDAMSAGEDVAAAATWWPFPLDSSFPWEPIDREQHLAAIGRDLLRALGADATQAGLRETPLRWARWWTEFLRGEDVRTDTVFEFDQLDHMVAVSGIRTWSMCEHHLLPFTVDATVAYLPTGEVLGLSKFARLVERSARRLQLQERMGEEVADAVTRAAGTDDVAVLLRGRHLCMEARGARVGAITTSIAARGRFRRDSGLRAELIALAGMHPGAGWTDEQRPHSPDGDYGDADASPSRLI